jgi:hypothetical protein
VVVTLNNLAAVAQARDAAALAGRCYWRAAAIKRRGHGPDHTDLAATWNNQALLCAEQGKHAQAEALYRRALNLLEKALGKAHPSTRACRANYAPLRRRATGGAG